jgi:N-acetylmuramoyl-L-alanine amidase
MEFGRPIHNIVLHCTATSQNATPEQIVNYWRNVLKWKQVGYHYMIDPQGRRHILAPIREVTNGVKGYNWNSIHISYIGGKDGDDRTDAQKKEMEALIKELIGPTVLNYRPNIIGHRDLSPDLNNNGIIEPHEWVKLCPQFNVVDWLKEINL